MILMTPEPCSAHQYYATWSTVSDPFHTCSFTMQSHYQSSPLSWMRYMNVNYEHDEEEGNNKLLLLPSSSSSFLVYSSSNSIRWVNVAIYCFTVCKSTFRNSFLLYTGTCFIIYIVDTFIYYTYFVYSHWSIDSYKCPFILVRFHSNESHQAVRCRIWDSNRSLCNPFQGFINFVKHFPNRAWKNQYFSPVPYIELCVNLPVSPCMWTFLKTLLHSFQLYV